MCGPTPTTIQKQTEARLSCSNDDSNNNKTQSESEYKYWPLHPLAVLALFPLLPTECYLNRGYTQWFHWTAVAYLLTRSTFLRRFLVVQGTGITLGWYSAIANDWYWNGKFCHVLYHNMPSTMTNVMVDSTSQTNSLLLDSWQSLLVMGLSHLLDTLGHPLLTLYFYRLHCNAGGSLRDLFSWNIVVSTYMLSRLWSLTHTLYNYGTPGGGLFYVGYDVYIMEDLNSWMAAYVAEGVFYATIVLYKILWEEQQSTTTTVMSATTTKTATSKATGLVDVVLDTKPSLIPSESGVSMESM
jgi:hypothetical protein